MHTLTCLFSIRMWNNGTKELQGMKCDHSTIAENRFS